MLYGQENSSMAVLINQSTKRWRTNVIDHVFGVAEVEVIKSIPLSSSSPQDMLIWPFTPTGQYSVKSGYRFLHEGAALDQLTTKESVFWKKKIVWGLEVPNKVKNFIWRPCKEALPTKANLCCRKIVQDALCENYKVRNEDGSHVFSFVLMCRRYGNRTHNGAGSRHWKGNL